MSKKPDIYFIRYDKERSGKRQIRLGLVGVGAIAQAKHIPSIMRLKTMWESSELIAVSDIDKKSGKKVADNFHINFYEEYREMIEKEELNGIIVTTPDTYHYEIARYALGKGLHVLVEKPLAMNTKEAKDLCLLAKNKGLILMTAFCKRYSEPYLRAKELISEGVLGDISMIAAKMCQG
ncbi:MAG: Gfo/Idh/MocA family oxidoreductase, partial [Firmicutes bacterium]|nr:Gfo/Idh/MocA family oxidoreductase [Bacillota bacterium]